MDLQPALEQWRARRDQEDRDQGGAGGACGDMSENEDGILLVPEGEAAMFVCWCRTGDIAVASSLPVTPNTGVHLMRGSAMASGNGNCPVISLLIRWAAVRVSSLLLQVSRRLSYTHLLLVCVVLAEG